ncbi:MAG: tetraacyldisaccharide 4'-kinase [Pyrinomonadaceae bacterium]
MLSPFYGKIMTLRNALYDKGVFDTFDLGARVISVGNITTGGTGKTPLVAYIAEVLAARGEKVCILTRGYGRTNRRQRVLVSDGENVLADAQLGGDEPVELARKLLGKAIVIADAARVSAAEWALRKFGVTVFVLDDGFQHRKVKRDLDIVCIDATNPCDKGRMLPFGRLREPLRGLARADAIVITRSDLAGDVTDLRTRLARWNPSATIFEAENIISGVTAIEEFHATAQRTQKTKTNAPALAFCAVGNPESFFETLRLSGVEPAATKSFKDHHHYTPGDVREIEASARSHGAEILLTTAKDAVKILDLKFELPCFVVEIEMKIKDTDAFEAMVSQNDLRLRRGRT